MSYRSRSSRPRKWPYDAIANKYELFPSQLANLQGGIASKAAERKANLARVRALQAKGYAAPDIILLTGLSRATVYRHLAREA